MLNLFATIRLEVFALREPVIAFVHVFPKKYEDCRIMIEYLDLLALDFPKRDLALSSGSERFHMTDDEW